MSFASQNSLLINSNSRISFHFTNTHFNPLKTPNFSLSIPSKYFSNPQNLQFLSIKPSNSSNFISLRTQNWSLRALKSDGTLPKPDWIFDSFLPVYELLILFPLTVVSIGIGLNSSSQKPIVAWLGNKIHPWLFAILVSAVLVGYSIRMWQWRRICMYFSNPGDSGVNLLQRTEKLEEDLRSTATIIRVLSRQLEKLGIRFRVTRKSLKEPIAETAALAQKNSEATRALAAQEDILEKELGEIQKVLLAMQDQQQKQLELIIAISKTGKLWESKREHVQDPEKIKTRNSAEKVVNQIETNQIQAVARQKEANNDRV